MLPKGFGARFKEAVLEFGRGAFSPSLASWVGTVAFCLLEFTVCCWAFQPVRLARIDPRYLMESPNDEYASLSIRLIKLRYLKPKKLQVSYAGGSQATRALATRDFDVLSQELSQAAGTDASFNLFSSNNQRYEELLGITDQFPSTYRGVLVYMVSDYKNDFRRPDKLKMTIERLPFASAPSLAPFWLRVDHYRPRQTGVFFIDHLGFFAARRLNSFRLTKVEGNGAPNAGRENEEYYEQAMKKLAVLREELNSGSTGAQRKINATAPILASGRPLVQKALDNMRKRGIITVFLEQIYNPFRREILEERIEEYQHEFSDFAEEQGALYWDFNPELQVEARDFQDAIHIGSPRVRRQFQSLLMKRLGDLIRERFPNEPPLEPAQKTEPANLVDP